MSENINFEKLNAHSAFIFVSNNVKMGLGLDHAIAQRRSERLEEFIARCRALCDALSVPAEFTSVIGAYKGTYEAAVVLHFPTSPDLSELEFAASANGLEQRQYQAYTFVGPGAGAGLDDSIYVLRNNQVDLATACGLLERGGFLDYSVVPSLGGVGVTAVVLDFQNVHLNKLGKLASRGFHIHHLPGNADAIGDSNSPIGARSHYRKAIADYQSAGYGPVPFIRGHRRRLLLRS